MEDNLHKPVGLGAQIAETLKAAILEGEFRGGEQLGEHELQLRFGVSRSPLREAFRELEKFGLVEIVPRRGSFVKRITRKDIEENFPVRAALEGLAARLAVANLTGPVLEQMTGALAKMETAARAKDTQAYYTHHLIFHEVFIRAADNELLKNTLEKLRMQSLWHRFSYQWYQEDIDKSFRVHQDILTLFKAPFPDGEKIGLLVEHHINMALQSFLAYLTDHEEE
jgi:DNA-binding GntR family transcriptional regulator